MYAFTQVLLWTGRRREDPRASINRHGTRCFATAYCDTCQLSSAGRGANERQISYAREDHAGSNVFSHEPFSLLVFILGAQYNILNRWRLSSLPIACTDVLASSSTLGFMHDYWLLSPSKAARSSPTQENWRRAFRLM